MIENPLKYLQSRPGFFLIAGPCVIEGEEMAFRTGRHIQDVCRRLDIPFAFKGSYRKANRSRLDSFRGIGDIEALTILSAVGRELGVPVVTDIHEPKEAEMAADFADILQIPAFLCRQTDLLIAAARTGKAVNIKKGQFLAPGSMHFAVDKVRNAGGAAVAVTERGTTFGYGDLIVDYRGIPEMQASCECPVIVDCTHSLQQPNTAGGVTGGRPELIETIARAAVATGADGLFLETHPNPSVAKSDGANMLRLDLLEGLLTRLKALSNVVCSFRNTALTILCLLAGISFASAQSSIHNPITQAVLGVYEEELSQNPNNYGILMSRADEYYRHNEYIRALDDVNRVIELAPASDEDVLLRAYVLRAGIYNETKRHQQALDDLNNAAMIAPDAFAVIYQRANTEFILEKYADAKADFQRLMRMNSHTAEPYIGLARVAVKENNLGTANEMLEQAVGLDPNNAETYVRRASVRRLMGNHNGAVDDLILAISTDNQHERAMAELLEYGNTNYPATMAGLSSAVSQAPNVGMFRYIRATIAQAHYHYLAAIEDYETILDKGLYNYHGIYASIAECQYALGEYNKALDSVERALSMIRNEASHQVLRSKILRALGRNEDAIKAAADALAIDRESCDALVEMAMCYVAVQNYNEASALLGEAMLNDAEEARYPLLKAWVLDKFLNKPQQARLLYQQVAEMDHYFVDNPRSLRGFALYQLGDKEQAERWMKNILNTVTDYDGLIHYYGACFYSQADMMDKAMDCARKSLDLGYADYHNWTEAHDGYVNPAPLRDDLTFLNLLHRHNNIFGK